MIEEMRHLLKQPASIFLGQVIEVGSSSASELLVRVKRLPEGGELIAASAFGSGSQDKPMINDIAIIVLAGDDTEYATILGYLPNSSRSIHDRVGDGDTVVQARPDQKLHLVSDTRVNIGKGGDDEESEPLVLGAVLTTYLSTLVADISSILDHMTSVATHLGTVAGAAGVSGTQTAMTSLVETLTTLKAKVGTTDKSTYLTTAATNIKSKIAFTERG